MDEAYTVLGLNSKASNEEIKKAYRALVKEYHPDKYSALDNEAIRQATETMKQINMAWEVVKTARGIK
ncbi:MAG: DnaJ domain-containing protein [Paludibacteraceae bacterium]|nr:DnaJ domain-containing protein [Paludibacteraceae bacterium]